MIAFVQAVAYVFAYMLGCALGLGFVVGVGVLLVGRWALALVMRTSRDSRASVAEAACRLVLSLLTPADRQEVLLAIQAVPPPPSSYGEAVELVDRALKTLPWEDQARAVRWAMQHYLLRPRRVPGQVIVSGPAQRTN